MLRVRELSVTEVRKSWFYKGGGKFQREKASLKKRSKTAIHNVIITNKVQIILNFCRKKVLTAKDNREIFRLLTKKGLSIHEISKSFSKRTLFVPVWKSLKSNSNPKFMNLLNENLVFLKHHQYERLKSGKNILS